MEAAKVIENSIATSTLKQYDVGLRAWFAFCRDSDPPADPLEFSVPRTLTFLTLLFHKGASYGTLNSTRSAISLITDQKLGQDPGIKRFFKGIFRLRPSRPKYKTTWDPSIVLTFLRTIDNDTCELDLLTKKTVTLLAIVTAHRVQTLTKVNIDNIKVVGENVTILIPDLIKTSGPKAYQPILQFSYYNRDPAICVARSLMAYLTSTKDIRGEVKHLILTTRRPFLPASTATVSRWIKEMLCSSGLDTTSFTAHSTRHASTSAAARNGVSIDTIRATATWSSSSNCFAKFYNRPREKVSFQHAVLNSEI